jgi:hypothetical protein
MKGIVMGRKFLILALLLPALMGNRCSCDGEEDTITGPSGSNIVEVTWNITVNTTWSADSIYVVMKNDFVVNAVLTIEEGTVIKFTDSGPGARVGSAGRIHADGTEDDPIIFTSYKDDDHGGDTNDDGSGSAPAPQDWGYINTDGRNGSLFDHCRFYYGGGSTCHSTLYLAGGSVATVTHCVFAYNDGNRSTDWDAVLDASRAGAGTVIQDNTFYGNFWPLSVSTTFDLDNSNSFHNPVNTAETNVYNGIYVYAASNIRNPVSWSETEVAFVIENSNFWIAAVGQLTLRPQVVIKFGTGSLLVLGNGVSAIDGEDETGVYFTSLKDDDHKGDTNGDGSATTPGAGDWLGIKDETTGLYVNWANILYSNTD